MLDEFYRVAFRRKIYDSIRGLQADLDEWMDDFNLNRTHQGRYCFGKTPMQTFLDAAHNAREKGIGRYIEHHMNAYFPERPLQAVRQIKCKLLHSMSGATSPFTRPFPGHARECAFFSES